MPLRGPIHSLLTRQLFSLEKSKIKFGNFFLACQNVNWSEIIDCRNVKKWQLDVVKWAEETWTKLMQQGNDTPLLVRHILRLRFILQLALLSFASEQQ